MIDLLFDHLPDAVRNSDFNILDIDDQRPPFCGLVNQSFRDEIIDCVDQEKWASVCPFVDQRSELCWKTIAGKSNREILTDGLPAEVLKRQLFA